MISEEQRCRMRRLFFAEHWKVGTIAAELGVHRDTVRLAIEAPRFTNTKYRKAAMILDPYREFIRATLEQYPRLRATRLPEMIRARGSTGSVFPVRRFVRAIRPTPNREALRMTESSGCTSGAFASAVASDSPMPVFPWGPAENASFILPLAASSCSRRSPLLIVA